MIEESNLTKLYYTIGEVAEMFDVKTSNIRFWEKHFPSLSPKKNKKGNRLFTKKDILVLNRIYHLIHNEGYTIEGANKALKRKNTSADPTRINEVNQDIVDKLNLIKQKLLALKQ